MNSGLKALPGSDIGYGLGLGFQSYAEIRNRDRNPSLCNVNMFCIVQCSHQVWNLSPSPCQYPSPVTYLKP